MTSLLTPRSPTRVRATVSALLAPGIALGVAQLFGPDHLAAATALALLGAVAAAAVGGRVSGIVASIAGFLGLNYFFTEPLHTFGVRQPADLIALLAFLVSALIVGALVGRVVEERSRAERRASEARFLNQTTAKLISGESIDRVLENLADSLVTVLGLAGCGISTPNGAGRAGSLEASDDAAGPRLTVPLATESGSFGSLVAVRPPEREEFASSEVALLRTLASQTALAIERAGLDEQVRTARMESEANAMRAALFSSVTHDLKTPLSSIKASASGLRSEGARYSEEQREEMLTTILEEAEHLNQIVSNLLDLARVRAGALVPSKQEIFIEDVIAGVLRRMRRRLEGMPLRTVIRPGLPPVHADPVQIAQVFSNLLENAVRFSAGKELQITAARWESVIRVTVTDHGPGILHEDRERVFEEFFRRDAGKGRGGSGLGLAIARAIVVAHGGRISVEGAPGGGTAVTFELPVARVSRREDASPARKEVLR